MARRIFKNDGCVLWVHTYNEMYNRLMQAVSFTAGSFQPIGDPKIGKSSSSTVVVVAAAAAALLE